MAQLPCVLLPEIWLIAVSVWICRSGAELQSCALSCVRCRSYIKKDRCADRVSWDWACSQHKEGPVVTRSSSWVQYVSERAAWQQTTSWRICFGAPRYVNYYILRSLRLPQISNILFSAFVTKHLGVWRNYSSCCVIAVEYDLKSVNWVGCFKKHQNSIVQN
jgi:hypothetical protein